MLRRFWTYLVGAGREVPLVPRPAKQPLERIDLMRFKLVAVDEAIGHLGLLRPEAAPAIAAMIDDLGSLSPRGIVTTYRKRGEQLSAEEKRALGVRSNAFLSREAYADLTAAGRDDPLSAHETTLLRAIFSVFRAKTVNNAIEAGFDRFEYNGVDPSCPFCGRSGVMVLAAEASILPDPACECPTANYSLNLNIDWLAGVS